MLAASAAPYQVQLRFLARWGRRASLPLATIFSSIR